MNLGVSKDKGITIRLFLDSPIPLLKILGELPEVETASSDSTPQTGEKPKVKRVLVTTQK
jgi:hypothetical protein